ncbi:hypothetical protein [Streptomyces bikiniensis]|uniref:hypothetical protein n=1 Tax=Streptomyces bikiniensis TaxID=1896 RepID=UPI0006900968|nr:hypothetical protein [Streptomyces bikiniensis]
MTMLDDILSRALLVHDRAVPRDAFPPHNPEPPTQPPVTPSRPTASSADAAEDLRALCETLVRHTPATAVSAFVTDQVPEPSSALVLACVLQLTDTDDGARFWWQYAAGAGQPGAAYCLYLHHLALGETHTARWWHTQTDEDKPSTRQVNTTVRWNDVPVVLRHEDKASTGTIVRVLRTLAQHITRPRSAVVTELMNYMPTAVAVGYLREPDSELPLPGPAFAHKIQTLLDAAAGQPDSPGKQPPPRRHTNRPALTAQESNEAATR